MTYYVVRNRDTCKKNLVEAANKAQAFRLVGETLIEVELASTSEVVQMLESGATVLRSIERQQELGLD